MLGKVDKAVGMVIEEAVELMASEGEDVQILQSDWASAMESLAMRGVESWT
jgi:hypothetical protein